MQTALTLVREVEPSPRARLAAWLLAARQTGRRLLEIVLVLAILAAVIGIVTGPRVICMHGPSKVETTRIKLKMYAFEAYPAWAAAHDSVGCPASFAELSEYMIDNDATDAWGRPLELWCGAHGIGVVSRGEDGQLGTDDDLMSWQP